jgi:2-dehydro-3-deoxyphosphogluconate aldolase/(4S)-4-hydroxy-2-oxoglutarate aldolase
MVHIGINAENEENALKAANRFSALFGFQNNVGNSSIFSGAGIEIMKSPYLGKNGHIAIGTNCVLRAKAFFERQGVDFNPDGIKTDDKGKLVAAYFKEEIGGFAVHLVRKK